MAQLEITAGLDLGDRYSHLCLIDTRTGDVLKERCASPRTPRPSGGASREACLRASRSRQEPTPRGSVGFLMRGAATRSSSLTPVSFGPFTARGGRRIGRTRRTSLGLRGSGPQAALTAEAPRRGVPGTPGPRPLARGLDPLQDPARQPRAWLGQDLRGALAQVLG
jgi:hypothetical protein